MTDQLTPAQTLLVWCILAKQGVAWQKDIVPAVKALDRKVLEAAKLVSVTKVRGALKLKLEDKGWGWAGEHLRDPLPPAQGTLRDFMIRLHEHLANSEKAVSDFIGTAPELIEEKAVIPKILSFRSIKAAYLKASDKNLGVRVLLSDVRKHLPKVAGSDLAVALCKAHLSGKLILMRLDNPMEITEAVKAAQIDFKGVTMHLIRIEK